MYILQCADDTFYTGITNQLEQRVTAHNAGTGAKYTRGRGPVVVRYQASFENRSTASKEEYRIKQLTQKQKLELIKNGSPTKLG